MPRDAPGVSPRPHCQMFQPRLAKRNKTLDPEMPESVTGEFGGVVMRGVGGRFRDRSRLAAGKRRLRQAAALGALLLPGAPMISEVAWGQAAATLPEVTVVAPRPAPAP